MVWLVTHIWMFIALAALFGLILGWAFRGIRFNGGARRAMVERDIALTELGQVRGELDSLYSAQRLPAAGDGGGDAQLQAELKARDARLVELEAELTASRDALEIEKTDGEKKVLAAAAAATAAAVAGAGAAVMSGRDEPEAQRLDANLSAGNAQVEWRNRYLESRIRSLETVISSADEVAEAPEQPVIEDQSARVAELEAGNEALQGRLTEAEDRLAEAQQEAESAAAAAQSENNGVAAGLVGAAIGAGAAAIGQEAVEETPVDTTQIDKLNWKNDYLRQRLAFMEEHGAPSRAEAVPSEAAETVEPVTVVEDSAIVEDSVETNSAPVLAAVEADSAPDIAPAEPGDIEQELARLRWRNRYLEGRLAYIDGDASAAAEAAQEVDEGVAKQTSAAEALLQRLEQSDSGDI